MIMYKCAKNKCVVVQIAGYDRRQDACSPQTSKL
jgi:hypothetical protein